MENFIQQIKRLAELQKHATPGPWFGENNEEDDYKILASDGKEEIALMPWLLSDGTQPNATFIAAAGCLNFAALYAALAAPSIPTPAAPLAAAATAPGVAGEVQDTDYINSAFFAQTIINRFRIGLKLRLITQEEIGHTTNLDWLSAQVLVRAALQDKLYQLGDLLHATPAPAATGAPDSDERPIAECPYDVVVSVCHDGEWVRAVRWQAPADGDPGRQEWFFSPADDEEAEAFEPGSVTAWKPLPVAGAPEVVERP